MKTHVTRVVLDRYITPPLHELQDGHDITAAPGREMWRVSWTLSVKGRPGHDLRQSHATEIAARRHAGNLLADRLPGTAIDDIYTEKVD